MIRCRLVARWSFLGRALFWSAAGLQVVLIGAVGHWGAWGLAITLPLLVWWLNGEKRHLTRVTANFLDELAKEFRLVKVTPSHIAKAQARIPETRSGAADRAA